MSHSTAVLESPARTAPRRYLAEGTRCAACQQPITDDNWFCRVPNAAGAMLLCCPTCALMYFNPPAEVADPVRRVESYEDRVNAMVDHVKACL